MALPVDSFFRQNKRKPVSRVSPASRKAPELELCWSVIFKESYFHFGVHVVVLSILTMFIVLLHASLYLKAPSPIFSMHESLVLPSDSILARDHTAKYHAIVYPSGIFGMGTFYTAVLGEGVGLSSLAQRYQLSIATLLSINKLTNLDESHYLDVVRVPFMDGLLVDFSREKSIQSIANHYGVDIDLLRATNHLSTETVTVKGQIFIPGHTMSPSKLRRMIGDSFIYPVFGTLTQTFGSNRDSITGLDIYDNGIIFQTQVNTPVLAIADGTIIDSGFHVRFGHYLLVQHQQYRVFYGYLGQAPETTMSLRIKQGEVIGKTQNKGKYGYCFLSIILDGEAINPIPLLR
ncbi:peptidoglycan DD-metalloendopeptidase family protein [Entomospira entomophila]|uniref:M23 family metallopeptidase n=1 Tax=Entomospira entomophila TaxID=2719988 RepID=A0A968G8M3_9SPIO|nr:peptidoglycan DD-metalloendopeptidase family protein [Entomospira entomophilus]NIZ40587.1 M23 family metallopeptidase [Entomospira entomophilus]WDI34802.1 peptidoglycan DD-metalloendopeptidase family protein [Entomospira entomophilus]